MSASRNKGFTLIELMIVVVVIGVLAAIALPAYKDYAMKARRSDGLKEMLAIQLALEKWRANNSDFTANIVDDLKFDDTTSPDGYYAMSIALSGATYTISADPQGIQAVDTACDPMTMNPDGQVSPAGCAD